MTHQFKRELARDILDECAPLLMEHWKEIAHNKDIPLSPRLKKYIDIEDAGCLRVFTVREEGGTLVGYCIFFVALNMHYESSLQAVQDIIYVKPGSRGMGGRFIKWCDEQLKKEGIQIVQQHIKAAHNYGKMLERMGYELVDLIYQKRLDLEAASG